MNSPIESPKSLLPLSGILAVTLLCGFGNVWAGLATPTFSKAFNPNTIGLGGVSSLEFTITNNAGPATDLAFSDSLPAGVVIATPSNVVSSCGGTVSAPAGGTTITFSGGLIAGSTVCTVSVDVTSVSAGVYVNTSGDLTSSLGNSGPASATLTASDTALRMSKSFTPSAILFGGTSTVSLNIENPTGNPAFNLSLSDTLPSALTIANPANAFTTCPAGVLTANPGGSTVTFVGGAVLASSSCQISFDVAVGGVGTFVNLTSDLQSNTGSNGRASAVLTASSAQLFITKEFTDDPVPPGSTATLRFNINNFNRSDSAFDVTFTDDLDATLAGLVAVSLPSEPCGPGSLLTGTNTISLSGGNLEASGSCSFDVTVQVPAGAVNGSYPNTTSDVNGVIGAESVVGNAASDELLVQTPPLLTKSFTDDPVVGGDTVTLEFTIENTSTVFGATSISFQDNLTQVVPGLTPSMLPAAGFCGMGSTIVPFAPASGEIGLLMTGGSLAPGASCTFQATLQVPTGIPAGSYLNTTGAPSAIVDGVTYLGNPASDSLEVLGAPVLSKDFTDDPVVPGDTVTLEFTISRNANANGDATNIAFTDDLSFLPGLTAVGLPANDICGAGSSLTGTTTLSFAGGTLAPGDSCTFSVILQVPAAAAAGGYDNTTSEITATALGMAVTGNPASDTLQVAGLTVTKEFTDDPVVPGGTATLRFSIQNNSPVSSITNIAFTDDLNAALAGLQATAPLPTDPCGMGSSVIGTSLLIFSGGNLAPGASCVFDVTVQVPTGATPTEYTNTTSQVTADVDGSPVTVDPAVDILVVTPALMISKSFTDDPASPGGLVTLEFTISNGSPAAAATAITFTDDLNGVLPGLAAEGLPANDVCGAGSTISGTGLITLAGGNLPAAGSCTFSVSVRVPMVVPIGTSFVNTTSAVSGTVGGVGFTGNSASDTLQLVVLTLTKAFDGPTVGGGLPRLVFTIENLGGAVSDLSFGDDLNAVLPGLQATGLPANNVCGTGSVLTGTSTLVLSGGVLGASSSCSFDVLLQVPAGAAPGSYLNTTTDLRLGGLSVSQPATATLVVEPPPLFSKTFSPDEVGIGLVSTLTFSIDNTASALAATNLGFTDNLPANLTVASPANASTTCTGGTLTAASGSGVISYSGGTVAAGSNCTLSVDVTGSAAGSFVNTTEGLTSSSGSSGTASDTLTVHAPPVFSKAFAPNAIQVGGVSTLTFTVDLSAGTGAATGLAFSDTLPAGIVVATPANASSSCGGTVTAAEGTGMVSLSGGSVAAGATCTVQVDVTGSTAGIYANTSDELTSSLGSSGTASDTLNVVTDSIFFEKEFIVHPVAMMAVATPKAKSEGGKAAADGAVSAAGAGVSVLRGGLVDLEYTITNTSSVFPLTNITFSDDLDAAVPGLTAVGLPVNDVCGAGSQVSGTSVVTLTNGSLAVSSSCTFQVTVQIPASAPVGTVTSVSGPATGNAGGVQVEAGSASASVEVIFLDFSKAFTSYDAITGEAVLEFTISNPDVSNGASDITFTDDLDAVVPGLAATGLPVSDVCGPGSVLSGTSVLSLTGGNLGPSESCTFDVTLQVPADAAPGTFTNVTSPIEATVGGQVVTGDEADAAQAVIDVRPVSIPLLSDWGLVLLFLSLGAAALWRLGRRPAR